jgi:predicted ribosomally synthesized peptide with nif11-like leader
MSVESANRFLHAAAQDQSLRDQFAAVQSPDDFLETSQHLGYDFTLSELKAAVNAKSQNIVLRRNTGVWKWLREVKWV